MDSNFICKPSGRICAHPLHRRSRIETDGTCRVGRAWARSAVTCSGCETPIPAHLALSPSRGMFNLERLPDPGTSPTAIKLVTELAHLGTEARLCNYCAEIVYDLFGVTLNRLKSRSGYIALFETESQRAKAKRDGDNRRIALYERLLGPMDPTLYRGARSVVPDGALTECTMHANEADLCRCGGWHPWSRMLAFRAHGTNYFGFGPECAEDARAYGLNLHATLRHAVHRAQNEKAGREEFVRTRKRRNAA